jgi:hypothetical protein
MIDSQCLARLPPGHFRFSSCPSPNDLRHCSAGIAGAMHTILRVFAILTLIGILIWSLRAIVPLIYILLVSAFVIRILILALILILILILIVIQTMIVSVIRIVNGNQIVGHVVIVMMIAMMIVMMIVIAAEISPERKSSIKCAS